MMKYHLLLVCLFLLSGSSAVAAEDSAPAPTAEDIVARMTARDLQRQSSIDGYAGMRRYVFENQKMKKHAEMLVKVKGDQDGTKHFEVVSEDGWKAAHKYVLHKMLESESETSRPEIRASAKLTRENYDFQLVGTEELTGRVAYVLEVRPKRNEKNLFRGRIWVDVEDYALARVEGNPAKKPSFWTKSIHFVQVNEKRGPLWFPLSTQSVTEAHLFGTTDVNIEYFDYAPQGQPSRGSSEITLVSAKGTDQP
jgi:outer membrane lipoprotein-sorting protein